jgi:hypothetical protein
MKMINKTFPSSTLPSEMSVRRLKVITSALRATASPDGWLLMDRCGAGLNVGPFATSDAAAKWLAEAYTLVVPHLKAKGTGRSAGQKRWLAANRMWLIT